MIKSVAPYIGKYKKYTVIASFLTTLGIIANVVPYFILYQLIVPITQNQVPDFKFVAVRVAAIFVCLALYAVLYSRGLAFSHISAYNTLKNIRISLKSKLENQPLANIKELGTGQIKRVFTDDIDQIELLLAHAIPEGKTYNRRQRQKLIYLVMQDVNHQLFTESVLDEVLISQKEANEEEAHRILASLDLEQFANRHPQSLSGGQKQRVAVASAIASGRYIMLFDEPTSGLDYTHMLQIGQILRQLQQMGKTVIVVTHDRELIKECCDEEISLKDFNQI